MVDTKTNTIKNEKQKNKCKQTQHLVKIGDGVIKTCIQSSFGSLSYDITSGKWVGPILLSNNYAME